nr:TRAP transporter large permease [uncultured Marvinbryantia sp.]
MSLAVQTAIVMVVLLVVMLAMGVSISVSVGLSSAVAMLCMLPADVSFTTSAQRLFAGANSFSLIAIPFFILAGNLMNNGGIAERLVNVAKVIAGRMPGALAQTNVIGNMMFGAISGSGAAAAAAMGGVIGPMEKKEGYDDAYSTVVNIASAPTGMLIPPSNLMIVYSTVAGSVSVAALFMGGYLPGILWGAAVMVLAGITARRRGYVIKETVTARMALKAVLDAIPSLLLIIIIIGGILCGAFTATEASAVAVAYDAILGLIYKGFTIGDLPRIILASAKMTGIITLMIGLSSIMSWVMAFTGLPDIIAGGLLSMTDNKYVILMLMNVILLVVGTFMDPTPAVLIFTPIFLPICQTFGMHPVQFGIMVSMNLCIGTITPPVGSILFTGCKVGGIKIEQVIRELLPYFGVILVALLLVTYIPSISMALPEAAGLIK